MPATSKAALARHDEILRCGVRRPWRPGVRHLTATGSEWRSTDPARRRRCGGRGTGRPGRPRPGPAACGCGPGWGSRRVRPASATATTSARCRTEPLASWPRHTVVRCSSVRGPRRSIDGVGPLDLGDHRLPDLPRAERLFQVVGRRRAVAVPGARAPATRTAATCRCPPRASSAASGARRDRRAGARPPAGDPDRRRRGRQDPAVDRGGRRARRRVPGRRVDGRARPGQRPAAVPDAIADAPWASRRKAATPVIQTVAEALSGRRAARRARQLRAPRRRRRRDRRELLARSDDACGSLATSREALDGRRASSGGSVLPLALDGGVTSAAVTLVRRAGPCAPVPHRLRRAGDRGRGRRDLPDASTGSRSASSWRRRGWSR